MSRLWQHVYGLRTQLIAALRLALEDGFEARAEDHRQAALREKRDAVRQLIAQYTERTRSTRETWRHPLQRGDAGADGWLGLVVGLVCTCRRTMSHEVYLPGFDSRAYWRSCGTEGVGPLSCNRAVLRPLGCPDLRAVARDAGAYGNAETSTSSACSLAPALDVLDRSRAVGQAAVDPQVAHELLHQALQPATLKVVG